MFFHVREMIGPITSHRGVGVLRQNSRLFLQLAARLRTHSTRKVFLLKFIHFQLYIENRQLRLLVALGLPHVLTVIYVFNKRFY